MDIKYARERLTKIVSNCPVAIKKDENNFITNVIRYMNGTVKLTFAK